MVKNLTVVWVKFSTFSLARESLLNGRTQYLLFYKISYYNEEVHRTEPSLIVSIPWMNNIYFLQYNKL
jgi:hypothetical protein